MLVYSAALTLGLLLFAPWWLTRMATTQRYREGLWQRLGVVPRALRAAVRGKRVIWVHAVSVGEVLAATRLVEELEWALDAREAEWQIVISTTTRTGQVLAKQHFNSVSAESRVFYLPLDFAFAVRAYLRALKPQMLILLESELWPRMLHECAANKIPVVVANARVSDRTFARTQRFRKLWQRMASNVSLFLAQSDEDAHRLIALGASVKQVLTIGNLKYDIRAPKQSRIAELIKEAAAGRRVIVAGSTVGNSGSDEWEANLAIHAWDGKVALEHCTLLVLAPRHPENFDLIYSVAMEYPTLRATELLAGKKPNEAFAIGLRTGETALVEIIVLDTIGDLAAIYGIADIAFVGGSLVKRGGHNPLEPARFGVPVIMGPSYENFRDVVGKMKDSNAIRIVKDNDELVQTFIQLLTNPDEARAMGERGRQVFEQQQGATGRTVDALLNLLNEKVQG